MIIIVKVKPGSSRPEVLKEDATHYIVRVHERAVDGKANDAVIRALADYFDCAPSLITIKSGHASRTKRIDLAV
ncbi:MAG: DUF167 domain-containing protein [bacterium]|nr:DUF167 domain-containing protein [bacterium]